jgi:hypothetical protein
MTIANQTLITAITLTCEVGAIRLLIIYKNLISKLLNVRSVRNLLMHWPILYNRTNLMQFC